MFRNILKVSWGQVSSPHPTHQTMSLRTLLCAQGQLCWNRIIMMLLPDTVWKSVVSTATDDFYMLQYTAATICHLMSCCSFRCFHFTLIALTVDQGRSFTKRRCHDCHWTLQYDTFYHQCLESTWLWVWLKHLHSIIKSVYILLAIHCK